MLNKILIIQNTLLKALLCCGCAYLLCYLMIGMFLRALKNKSIFRQPIRESGPASHLVNKKNTPTMGGIFIVLSTLFTSVLLLNLKNDYLLITLLVFTSFGIIGLIDDLLKVVYKNHKGFRGSYKLLIQFAIIGVVVLWLGALDNIHSSSSLFLPFTNHVVIGLGMFYVLFVTVVVVGSSNAVNLTDGLDGLVSVPAIINLICLSVLIYLGSSPTISTTFGLAYVEYSRELIYFCAALIGSIFAFLQFNLKPAKIFMGDVGSLAIGSALGIIAIIIKQEIVFFVISLLFVIEAVSVILQVSSYKLRKKRIFLMAPIHHHFEKKGWSEEAVVRRFWLASVLFAIVGMVGFML